VPTAFAENYSIGPAGSATSAATPILPPMYGRHRRYSWRSGITDGPTLAPMTVANHRHYEMEYAMTS
jgi:hypothetical protein